MLQLEVKQHAYYVNYTVNVSASQISSQGFSLTVNVQAHWERAFTSGQNQDVFIKSTEMFIV